MKEKILKRKSNGFLLLLVNLLATIFSTGMIIYLATKEKYVLMILFVFISILSLINYAGFKMVGPQEAIVLTLFGKYIGSIKSNGFYYVNPFVVSVNPAAKTKLGQSADVDKESKNLDINRRKAPYYYLLFFSVLFIVLGLLKIIDYKSIILGVILIILASYGLYNLHSIQDK